MNKFIKKIVAGALLLISIFAVSLRASSFASAATTENEFLDVYLIAGQSNAVGLSKTSSLTCGAEKLEEYKTGYSNVLYRGHGDSVNVEAYNETVKAGLGSTNQHIGTELGIAEVISAKDAGQTSLIVKRAVGGSYLVDEKSVSTEANRISAGNAGNWCPPSMRAETPLSEYTGALYDDFVAIVKESVDYYREAGYTVRLKGTFWMQGEAETDPVDQGGSSRVEITAENYARHLTALINDLREDFTGVFDNYVASAPFIIGKIAPTFNGGGAGVEKIRGAQDTVANTLSRVYTVDTDEYVIVDPTTGTWVDGCYDRYHFNGDDIVSLGKDVANAFLNNNEAAVEVFTDGNGSSDIAYKAMDGNPVTVTFTPKEYYSIGKLTANGVDVTAQMQGNSYTVASTQEYVCLIMEFKEYPKYTMSLAYDRDCASIQKSKGSYFYYAGETLTLKIIAKVGYEIASVTFDGRSVQANADGEYEITITSGNNIVAVTFNEVQTQPTAPETSVEYVTVGGCNASLGAVSGVALLAGVAIAMILKKKQG